MITDPGPSEIKFADQDGNIRKIDYEPGDYQAGLYSDWTISDDADWEVVTVGSDEED